MVVNAQRKARATTPAVKRLAAQPSSSGKVDAHGEFATIGTVPLDEVVRRQISEVMLYGEWGTGAVLPNEVAASRSLGVAVGTVRRALSDLTAARLLARRRKTGTVFTGRSPHHSLRSFGHYFPLHGRDGSMLSAKVENLAVATQNATPRERSHLRLAPGSEVSRIDRPRLVGGRPVVRDRYVPQRLPGFPTAKGADPDLLYAALLERYGIRIGTVRAEITSEFASAADILLLKLKPPAPELIIEEIAFDQAGAPVIFGSHVASTRRHCYINEVR
jgi:GntR family transcriptional regulator